jgi:hypothetical protein
MKATVLILCLFLSVLSVTAEESTFAKDKKHTFAELFNFGILIGPEFPPGDQGLSDYSVGYNIAIEGRYQVTHFLGAGLCIGRISLGGDYNWNQDFLLPSATPGTSMTSLKTFVLASFHFGFSPHTFTTVFKNDGLDRPVEQYHSGQFYPFLVLDVGPYFWSWETDAYPDSEESGTDMMIRFTPTVVYYVSDMISVSGGIHYSMWDFSGDFTTWGFLAGIKFRLSEL